MRVIAFATGNAASSGDYFDGLAPKISNSCAADDDLSLPLGDPREASVRAAIDFLAGGSCTTPIAQAPAGASAQSRSVRMAAEPEMLTPAKPRAAQRELPGLF
jgi:hypothetical protein